MKSIRFLAVAAILLLVGLSASAQLTTGSLTGTVTSSGTPLPGATITIASSNLQGTRTAVSDASGNYNFGGLPPGSYTVKFELEGLKTVTQNVKVSVTQTSRADADLQVSAVTESITVTASAPAVAESTEVQSNVTAKLVEALPMGRTLGATVNLAPGVTSNGPGGNLVISGAQSYDSSYYVDGAVVNEVLRGQPQNLFIEDALQETTVQTGAISAEFGRFTGGVVTAVSKSGGNQLSGTLRDTVEKPGWTAEGKDLKYNAPSNKMQSTYEGTIGGPIVKDRLWFFGAGRYFGIEEPRLLTKINPSDANLTYNLTDKERRFEGKLTANLTEKHSLVGSYFDISRKQTGNCQLGCLTEMTLQDPRELPNKFYTLNYNGVLTNSFFVEANYAKQLFSFVGGGGVEGPITTASHISTPYGGAGAPPFCGNCSAAEERNNVNEKLKGNYFWSPKNLGSHTLAVGLENYEDMRSGNNEQSGSGFVLVTQEAPRRAADGSLLLTMHSVDTSGIPNYILWWPILEQAGTNKLKTRSVFANDKWDFGSHWSFNLGVRYDQDKAKNQAGFTVADDSKISPRLGAIYDVTGNGKLRINASYSQYASKIAEGNVSDVSSPAGAGSYMYWGYYGPDLVDVPEADFMKTVGDWFNSVGGTSNKSFLWGAGTSGINTQIAGTLKAPGVDEYTLGAATTFAKGFLRADYQYRKWNNFYTQIVNTTTGKVFDPLAGSNVDLNLVMNTDDFQRNYRAILVQGGYQPFEHLQIGGNYTYSKLRGNITGETSGSGPVVSAGPGYYPEFFNYANSNPVGFLSADQRNKLRAWASYDMPTRYGNFNVSALERLDSGRPYGAAGSIYVVGGAYCPSCTKNTFGYDPYHIYSSQTGTYWFTPRDQYRLPTTRATDLALNYSLPISHGQFFVEAKAFNVLNSQTETNVDTTVYTSTSTRCIQTTGANIGKRCASFNPFTTAPVEGINWVKGPNFGKAVNPSGGTFGRPIVGDILMPRTYRVSFGVRF